MTGLEQGLGDAVSARSEDIILTGLARAGTTLTCYLLNRVPHVVALLEPLDPGTFVGLSRPEAMARINTFFVAARESLLVRGTAPSMVEDGRVPDNPWSDTRDPMGKRERRVERGEVRFDHPLSGNFRLAIKHPALFTALLPTLVHIWPCFATIRNPLGVLLSRESVPALSIHYGRWPMAEAFDPELRRALDGMDDVFDRSIHVIDWALSQYRRCLPDQHVIRYEDIVVSGGSALAPIDPGAAALSEPLVSKNANPIYNRDLVRHIADRLLSREGSWRYWYSDHAIEALADELVSGGSS